MIEVISSIWTAIIHAFALLGVFGVCGWLIDVAKKKNAHKSDLTPRDDAARDIIENESKKRQRAVSDALTNTEAARLLAKLGNDRANR
mgnify:CR=1